MPETTWILARVTDYWDQRVQAIDRHSRRLEVASPHDQDGQAAAIRAAVAQHARELDDRQLAMAAFIMAADLYKAVSVLTRWDQSIGIYLDATAGSLLKSLTQRGLVLQYVVDNSFEPSEVGMAGPLEWYPLWFSWTGFQYICPQHTATLRMKADGHSQTDYVGQLPRYRTEGRLVAEDLIRRCQQDGRHFFFLEAGGDATAFEVALQQRGEAGVVSVLQTDAPGPGSRCSVTLPPALRE